jgi:hypothetical protein
LLAATVAKAVVADVIQPLTEHMAELRLGFWAVASTAEIRPVFVISEYKGAALGLTYAVSLAWVPHFHGDRCSWHRTVKQSRMDLRVEQRAFDGDMSAVTMNRLGGEERLRKQAQLAVERVGPEAISWWDSLSDPSAILTEALRQSRVPTLHHPDPGYVAAFTHARLGDLHAARSMLEGQGLPNEMLDRALARLDELGHPT